MAYYRKTQQYPGNRYTLIRDSVQQKKPFLIYNFRDPNQYKAFLYDLDKYGKLNYVLQTIHSFDNTFQRNFQQPSIFVTNEDTNVSLEEFKKIAIGSLEHYRLDSVICLFEGKVAIFYKNGEHKIIGSEIFTTFDKNEFSGDYYQIGSNYYTFA